MFYLTRIRPYYLYLAIAAGAFFLYMVGIGSYPLVDPDEPVYGQVAKEMVLGGDWLTPHYEGKPWFDKPPLFYWISSISARQIGPNTETASRLPSALFGAGLVCLVMLFGSSELGRRTGLYSAIVMGSCIQQIVLAHSAVTDMTFVFFLTGALIAYRRWRVAVRATLLWAILTGVMTGFAALTKGPVAPVLLFATFFLDLWIAKDLKRLWSWDVMAAVVSLLVVALPWYAAMYKLHSEEFVQGFLVANNITRFIKPEHVKQTGSWLSYFRNFGVLLLFFFPWSGFLPQAIKLSWRKNDCLRLCMIWAAVVFVFFSMSKTQLVTYIFPLYPAAALLVGYLWNCVASGDSKAVHGIRSGVWFGAIMGFLIAAGLVIISKSRFTEIGQANVCLAVVLAITSAASVLWTQRHRKENMVGSLWIMGGGMAVFMLVLILWIAPLVGPYISTRSIVKTLPRNPECVIAQYDIAVPSLLFYLGRSPQQVRDAEAAKRLLHRSSPTYLICRKRQGADVLTTNAAVVFKSEKLLLIANQPALKLKESVNVK